MRKQSLHFDVTKQDLFLLSYSCLEHSMLGYEKVILVLRA